MVTLLLNGTKIQDFSPLQTELGPGSKLKDVYVYGVAEWNLLIDRIIEVSKALSNVSFHTAGGDVSKGEYFSDMKPPKKA